MSEESYETDANVIWKMFQDEKLIADELDKMSKIDLDVKEILQIMSLDPDCKSIIGDQMKQAELLRKMKEIKQFLRNSNSLETWVSFLL